MRKPVQGMRLSDATLRRIKFVTRLDGLILGRRVTSDEFLRELARQALAVRVKRLRRAGIDPGPVLAQARADMAKRGKRKPEPGKPPPKSGNVFDG